MTTPLADAVDLVLAQAAARPAHPAVVTAAESRSYADLEQRIRAIAAAFAPVAEARVLIALPAGIDAYAAMFAAGLIGGTYTPVNNTAPPEKLRRIARLLQPSIVFATADISPLLAETVPNAVVLHPDEVSNHALCTGRGQRHTTAYVIFTSGSTGLPKGVVIPREALNHYIGWIIDSRLIRPEDRVSQYANIGFDLSVFEIYGALCCGATLYPVLGQGDRLWPGRMIQREGISVWTSVPSVINLIMQAQEATSEYLASVRLFNFCGEPLLREHLEPLFAACPNAEAQNTYGPTEATVSVTALRLTAETYATACATTVALGEPIPGMRLHLLGGRHSDEGEIVITGPQVASGYWRDHERTAEVFKEVTLRGQRFRCYFTGDWAERRGGHVFFRERVDCQVKVRGIRIELDEVAAAIREQGWPMVCVLQRQDGLAAVIERCDRADFDPAYLSNSLAGRLEPQAIPRTIRLIDRMPRNENGKIDRRTVEVWLNGE
jgi:D-alanine--poly(phosphoribitol) ligase subunit 1